MVRLVAILAVTGFTTAACGGDATRTISSPSPSATSSVEPSAEGVKQHNLTGTIMSVEKPIRHVADARVEITGGADTGRVTHSDSIGDFVLAGVTAGTLTLRVSKPGFQTWTRDIALDANEKIGVELFVEPPVNDSGASATGRCNDGSWTWAQILGAACTRNGGLAYGVCPGPLCKSQ
jgi:hypothetical protein